MSPWSVEQVEAVAPSPAAVTAAQSIASPAQWASTGADDRALWGSYQGSAAEPYATVVDHVAVGFRCTCPSRRRPCKHALALLLLWARGQVPPGAAPLHVESWMASRRDRSPPDDAPSGDGSRSGTVDGAGGEGRDPGHDGSSIDEGDDAAAPEPAEDRDRARDERVAKMTAGLVELDRWLDDRIRTGLSDPSLARYATWDSLAARLVDARAGSLANRVRRLAGLVGAAPDWHDDVLAELGLLHLLSQAGRRLGALPSALADGVATSVGWQVRRADVLAGVPDTDEWFVAGRSDAREDRIEVRRHWLRGRSSGRWALLLSFAAYRQSLDDSLQVGSSIAADLHRYPGPALRALIGERHATTAAAMVPLAHTVAGACDEIGAMIAAEPWLDRVPTTVTASPAQHGEGWVLTDGSGSLPILASTPPHGLGVLLAASGAGACTITVEWTPHGVLPLTVHLPDRTLDIGPVADESFVGST